MELWISPFMSLVLGYGCQVWVCFQEPDSPTIIDIVMRNRDVRNDARYYSFFSI